MKHLSVGIFHDDSIGRELGKKDTESDIVMFNRKADGQIISFMSPVEDKLSAKAQIISAIDAAIVVFNGMSRGLGETIVLLDSLGVSTGIAVPSNYVAAEQITAIVRNTSLSSFSIVDRDPVKLLEFVKELQPERDSVSPPKVIIDHSFSVRGVGEVTLGFVKKGVVRKYDELMLLPANKQVLVRSIQVQDEDQNEAEAGTRVGLAIKGATVEEMRRGSIIGAPDGARIGTELRLQFEKSPFYSEEVREGAFHIAVGMQTVPATIVEKNETSITLVSERPFVYAPEDTFLLLDLNAKKTRIMGRGRASS